ncbi:MAG: SDR family oxidoreductase [Pseudonocardia sp.]|nr:SDR family oxidoreductase [Pseudonocardia sp.]
MADAFSLAGRTALITGASRGIGAAIAREFAAGGADVALAARSEGDLRQVAASLTATGRRAVPIRCDVLDAADVAACVDRAWELLDGIDVLVCNAGGPVFQSPVLAGRDEGWQRTLDLNLTSVVRLCRDVGARMVGRGRGSIVNIASAPPTRAWPALAAYSAAKAAVLSLTASLAVECGPAGVRVNAICPGWVRTSVNRAYLRDPDTAATAVEAVPLARWGEPEHVATTARWLASDAAAYVTGATIAVDGGLALGQSRRWLDEMAGVLAGRAGAGR